MTRFLFGDDRPFPFLFLSKDYARTKNGAKVVNGSGTLAAEVSGFPRENIADGSRTTYCEIEKIAPRTLEWYSIYYDLSDLFNSEDDRIDVVTMECDPGYPVSALQILSYTDSGYTTGEVEHTMSHRTYSGPDYWMGVPERVDGVNLGKSNHLKKPNEGHDGNHTLIFLEDSIDYNHPYVRLIVRGVGRNLHGYDGSFDNGKWDADPSSNGPTIETSDPDPNTLGTTDNYYELSLIGKSQNQWTTYVDVRIRPNSEYIFWFSEKKTVGAFGSEPYPYQIQIEYYDKEYVSLGTQSFFKDDGTYNDGSWGTQYVRINYSRDGEKYSGATKFNSLHKVPNDTHHISIRFALVYSSGGTSHTWQLDDFQLCRANLPVDIEKTSRATQDNIWLQYIKPDDVSGTVRIRRIGMFKYLFGLSDAKDYNPLIHDVGGAISCNPQSVQDQSGGSVYNRGPNGELIGIYNKRSSPIIRRTFNIVMKPELKSKFLDLFSSPGLFGIVDMNCDWSEVAGVLNSMSFTSIPALSGESDKFDFVGSFGVEET